MAKKILYTVLAILIVYYIFTWLAVPYLDKEFNYISNLNTSQPSAKAQKIYSNLDFVADLHSDALLWKRDLSKKHNYGQVDLPRMREANVDLQVFAVVSKSPKGLNFENNDANDPDNITSLFIAQGRPIKSWFSLRERVKVQSDALMKFESNKQNNFRFLRTAADLRELENDNRKEKKLVAGLFAIEGLHVLEGKIENVQYIFDLGVRMAGFVHFFDNRLGGSGQGIEKGGITNFGLQVLKEAERLGIIVDLTHASDKLMDDILENATKPVLVSHTGITGINNCNPSRNLSDSQIIAIARTGGIIGIAFLEDLICSTDVLTIATQIKYVKELVGVEHVALGSDSDGSMTTIIELQHYPLLVDELLKLGFDENDIKAVMGGNIKRFLLENLPEK